MTSSALKKLTIEHLRGSVVPFSMSFEDNRKLSIIYGENGTGKTTICDALEFLSKGSIGSLDGKGLGNKTEKFWPSVGKKASDVSVTLETQSTSCSAKVHKGNVIAVPADKRPNVEVLRRSQILKLLEAQPSERYKAISRFIDVSGVEDSEAALKALIENLKKDRATAIAVVAENETTINQFWESAGKPKANAVAWAGVEIKRDSSDDKAAIKELETLKNAFNNLSENIKKLEQKNALVTLAKTEVADASGKLTAILANTIEGAAELVSLLTASKPYLHNHPSPDVCPLCESSDKAKDLGGNVERRLKLFTELQQASATKAAHDNKLLNAERALTQLQAEIVTDGKNFEKAKVVRDWKGAIVLPKNICPDKLEDILTWAAANKALPEGWVAAASVWQEQSKFSETLKKAFVNYINNVDEQKKLDILLPRLERTLEVVMEERRKFTDAVLKKIANEVGRLYEIVHPGEGLDKISMELDASKRASLEIGASFGGTDKTPPQAYFSQSHLDTLGLCVFLALAGMDNPLQTVLVLDDVLASVDEPHVERLIEMLYDEAIKFQHCVITTHYQPWKKKLKWGWLQNGQCHFIELTKWTIADGLKMLHSIPESTKLKQLIAETPPDTQLICSKAGVILEAILDFLTQLYECEVPRKKDANYTLGDLLRGIDKKLRQALKVEILSTDATGIKTYQTVSITPILEELTRIAQARNVFGAHFTALSFDLLDADAIGFGQEVLKLAEAIIDIDRGWPRNSKSGSYWATSGETRRLHPLKRPT